MNNQYKTISITWGTADVLQKAMNMGIILSIGDANNILEKIEYLHDANVGVNWGLIGLYIKNNISNSIGCQISEKEKKLSELIFGLKENGFDKDGYFIKDNKNVLYYDSKFKNLYVSYDNIWSVFEEEFDMEYNEIEKFVTKYVVDTTQIEVKNTVNFY